MSVLILSNCLAIIWKINHISHMHTAYIADSLDDIGSISMLMRTATATVRQVTALCCEVTRGAETFFPIESLQCYAKLFNTCAYEQISTITITMHVCLHSRLLSRWCQCSFERTHVPHCSNVGGRPPSHWTYQNECWSCFSFALFRRCAGGSNLVFGG